MCTLVFMNKTNPKTESKLSTKLKKKMKLFIIAAAVFVFVLGGLTIWGGIFVLNKASQIAASSTLPQKLNTTLTNLNVPKVNTKTCITTAQNLVSLEAWANFDVQKKLQDLKQACLPNTQAECMTDECVADKEYFKKESE